jgi:hypothetical protein
LHGAILCNPHKILNHRCAAGHMCQMAFTCDNTSRFSTSHLIFTLVKNKVNERFDVASKPSLSN